jgi:hypothetical protein
MLNRTAQRGLAFLVIVLATLLQVVSAGGPGASGGI